MNSIISYPFYLNQLNAIESVSAHFIERFKNVEVSTDREATLSALEPQHRTIVHTLGFDWQKIYRAEQVHSDLIANIDEKTLADKTVSKVISGADGLITNQAGVMLGIYVADCGAVFIVDQRTKALGLLHSGKKGTDANITGKAITKMQAEFGSDPADLLVVLAPCIRPPHYEVDFAARIQQQVLEAGVKKEHYLDCGICTATELERYYSYRAEKGNTGRMLALLGRK